MTDDEFADLEGGFKKYQQSSKPQAIFPPGVLRKGPNPYIEFSRLEEELKEPGPHELEVRQEYEDMIEIFQQKAGDEGVAYSLAVMVVAHHSEGAARGMRGTTVVKARQEIRTAIKAILAKDAERLKQEPVRRVIGHVAPLALAGTDQPDEIDLLLQAARFQRGNREYEELDQQFREFAVQALAESESKPARKALLSLLTDFDQETTRRAVRDAVLNNPGKELRDQCQWLVSLPRKDAVYHIVHELQGKSTLRAMFASGLGRWRYRGVFADLSHIADRDST